jgi:hypothetical protein
MERSHRTPLAARDGSPAVSLVTCSWCMGQRSILEPSPFGLLPVVCERCQGHGREARIRDPARPSENR